jgi:heme/copper-type cytochrome/quinol oxidase subunit 2
MKIVSTKQFWWRFNYLKRNGGVITVTDRTSEMDVKEYNRIELLVNKRVRWELGSEGFNIWEMNGAKDIPTLAKAYGIK